MGFVPTTLWLRAESTNHYPTVLPLHIWICLNSIHNLNTKKCLKQYAVKKMILALYQGNNDYCNHYNEFYSIWVGQDSFVIHRISPENYSQIWYHPWPLWHGFYRRCLLPPPHSPGCPSLTSPWDVMARK